MSDQKCSNGGDLKRREFLTRAAAAGGAAAAAALSGCAAVVGTSSGAGGSKQTPSSLTYRQTLDQAPELRKVGGVKTAKFGGKDFFIVRKSQTEVVALNVRCTHKNCKTAYKADEKKFKCPCHASAFDMNGKALSGPAVNSGPLNRFDATLEGNVIQVTLNS